MNISTVRFYFFSFLYLLYCVLDSYSTKPLEQFSSRQEHLAGISPWEEVPRDQRMADDMEEKGVFLCW